MRIAVAAAILALGACAAPRRHPLVPPEATYSPGAAAAGVGGLAATAAGAEMSRSGHSSRTRQAGAAATGGGVALLGVAMADAIRVEKEWRRLIALDEFMRRQRAGLPPSDDPFQAPDRAPAPRFEFLEDPFVDPPVRP